MKKYSWGTQKKRIKELRPPAPPPTPIRAYHHTYYDNYQLATPPIYYKNTRKLLTLYKYSYNM
jgi:hypothetical protein